MAGRIVTSFAFMIGSDLRIIAIYEICTGFFSNRSHDKDTDLSQFIILFIPDAQYIF